MNVLCVLFSESRIPWRIQSFIIKNFLRHQRLVYPKRTLNRFYHGDGFDSGLYNHFKETFREENQTQLKPFKWRKCWLLLLNIVWKFTFNVCVYSNRICWEAVRVRTDKANFGPTTIGPRVQPIHRMYIITCTFIRINFDFFTFLGRAFRMHCLMGVVALWIRHRLHRSSKLLHVLSRCFAAVMTKSV